MTGTMNDLSRRGFVKQSLAAAVAPAMMATNTASLQAGAPLTIVCVGAHPDDPESGCGGTLARYAAAGHAVTIVYLTRGERGIAGKSLDEAARIRSAECEAACRIIGAKPVFFGEIDGATEVTQAQVDAMRRLLAALNPDVVFTHWAVDTHMDHQVASVLTIRAWMALHRPRLYFFEVNSGSQTEGFSARAEEGGPVRARQPGRSGHLARAPRDHGAMARARGRCGGRRSVRASEPRGSPQQPPGLVTVARTCPVSESWDWRTGPAVAAQLAG